VTRSKWSRVFEVGSRGARAGSGRCFKAEEGRRLVLFEVLEEEQEEGSERFRVKEQRGG
jgi:hypothetical protein